MEEYIVVTLLESFQVGDCARDALARRLRQIRIDNETVKTARHAVADAAPVSHHVDAVVAKSFHLLGKRLDLLFDPKHRATPNDL